jgi:cytoplasmic iron level regulating protein YaaA (DUF328/UPF0246 family)
MKKTMAVTHEQRKQIKASLDNLFRIRDELMLLDMRNAKPEKFADYNRKLYEVGLAITAFNGQMLDSIQVDVAEKLQGFETATKSVAADLYALRRTADVLNAISKGMSTITSMITLMK